MIWIFSPPEVHLKRYVEHEGTLIILKLTYERRDVLSKS